MSINPMLYETQFLGFTPQTCMLRIYIAFQDYLFEVMVAVEKVILKKAASLPDGGVSAVQVRGSTEAFLRFMRERFDRLFVKMEQVLLQLVLNIPPNVLLPEDRCHEKYPQSKEELHLLQQEIGQLQAQYKAEVGAKQALLAELEVQKVVQTQLKKTLRWFDGLGDAHGLVGLGEMTAFLIQHSVRLRSLTEDITDKSKRVKMQ